MILWWVIAVLIADHFKTTETDAMMIAATAILLPVIMLSYLHAKFQQPCCNSDRSDQAEGA